MIDTQKVGGILRNEIALKQNPRHVSSPLSNGTAQQKDRLHKYLQMNRVDFHPSFISGWNGQ